MNGKIALSVLVSFIVTMIALIFLANSYPYLTAIDPNHVFFKQDFDHELKKILIIGSSQVGVLNSTLISNNISENHSNYDFYNLAHSGDNPEERLVILPEIILLDPTIVFYGISYRDIDNNWNSNQGEGMSGFQFDYDLVLETIDPKNKLKLKNINPSTATTILINVELKKLGLLPEIEENYSNKMPFYPQRQLSILANSNELENHAKSLNVQLLTINSSPTNEQVLFLKEIINELQKNDTRVVLFATPLSPEYTNMLSSNAKDNFKEILNEIEIEFNLKVYDLTYQYDELSIWSDSQHVASNPKSVIYTEEILKKIILEIEK